MRKKSTKTSQNERTISAEDFDAKFDAGEDVSEYLDMSSARVVRRVNVDFPSWILDALDKESYRLGVTRQSLIKMWLAERVDSLSQAIGQT